MRLDSLSGSGQRASSDTEALIPSSHLPFRICSSDSNESTNCFFIVLRGFFGLERMTQFIFICLDVQL